ncbi:MAG: SpoIIE family protein phosphatase [Deltaproteobacteria bacterium]|nr:SpoIIE family protein phosphatase [Deltaproteobacteria bacterium]
MKSAAVLAVESANRTRHIAPPSNGLIIGSSKNSGLCLQDDRVLPEHARLYKDPFGRWVIESIHKTVPINVNGTVGNTFSVQAGDRIRIGESTIRILDKPDASIIPNAVISTPVKLAQYSEPQTLVNESDCYVEFSRNRLEELDRVAECLAKLTDAQSLYPDVCDHLSEPADTVALIVKVPKAATVSVENSRVLCQRGKLVQPYQAETTPNPHGLQNIHLSKTVLEAVREKRVAFMATSALDRDASEDVRLSFIGDMSPRMVLAAPIAETPTGIDMLYIDQPTLTFRSDALGFFAVVARMISLSRKSLIMAEYKAERTALNKQLNTALEIQSNLMPKNLKLFDEVQVALYYKPAGWVGGDYCDLFRSSDGRLMFAVGDVSGKGMPAAMIMANLHSMIRSMLLFSTTPTQIVEKMNTMLCDTLLDGMFITLILGFLDPHTGTVEYVNAGHELPLKISSAGNVDVLGCPVNMPLGILPNKFITQTVALAPGDGLFIFSDGITDTFSPDNEKYGYDRLLDAVTTRAGGTCQNIADNVVSSMLDFRAYLPAGDDTTLIALKWKTLQ